FFSAPRYATKIKTRVNKSTGCAFVSQVAGRFIRGNYFEFTHSVMIMKFCVGNKKLWKSVSVFIKT
ncbi:MAG: hypothetical protein WCQ67_05460, partial [Treponema sp.]